MSSLLTSRDSLDRKESEPFFAPSGGDVELAPEKTGALTQQSQGNRDVPYRLTLKDAMDVLMELHPNAFEFSFGRSAWDVMRASIRRFLQRR
jgi:hypothetical protein